MPGGLITSFPMQIHRGWEMELQTPKAEAGGLQAGQQRCPRAGQGSGAPLCSLLLLLGSGQLSRLFHFVLCKGQIEKVFYLQRLRSD